jgi:hypothetical protein
MGKKKEIVLDANGTDYTIWASELLGGEEPTLEDKIHYLEQRLDLQMKLIFDLRKRVDSLENDDLMGAAVKA